MIEERRMELEAVADRFGSEAAAAGLSAREIEGLLGVRSHLVLLNPPPFLGDVHVEAETRLRLFLALRQVMADTMDGEAFVIWLRTSVDGVSPLAFMSEGTGHLRALLREARLDADRRSSPW